MNLKLIYTTILVICILFNAQSQSAFKKDTSYTVQSTFLKLKKKFPQIAIVKPQSFDNVIEKKEIIYKEIGARQLHLDAFLNKNEQLKPAVILVHGGGWKSGDKSMIEPLAQVIASKGFACFTVEYRLSTEAKFPAGIFDIKSAIQYVKEHAQEYQINPNQIAVLGCSSGGQMAALVGTTINNKNFEDVNCITKQSTSVQAIIDIDGILAFKHPLSEEGEVASLWLGGTYEENPLTWVQASAVTHTNKNTPPILFIGSQYTRFLAGKEEMIAILNKHNIYNQVEILTESPHSFWLFHPWFNPTINYITGFMDKVFQENKN